MIDHLLIAFTTAAVCMDLSRQKIDNGWILAGWMTGLGYQVSCHQLKGAGYFLLGSMIPIALLYILFYFRMLGAGDIKLFSVIGGILGPAAVVKCIGLSFVFGAILSVAVILLCGNLAERFRYFTEYMKGLICSGKVVPYIKKGNRMENIHFTIPILMSVLLVMGA